MKYPNINSVLKQAPYFTKQSLSLAIAKEGEGLNYWIKKLIKEKQLLPLKKGVYISAYYQDLVRQNPAGYERYGEYLANLIRFPSYVSLEYILAKNEFIPESVFAITSITTKSSRSYETNIGRFVYRHIKNDYYYGWKTAMFEDKQVKIATLAKALFDFFYLKRIPRYSWHDYLTNSGRFNWDVLDKKNRSLFTQIINNSGSNKMQNILSIIQEEKLI